MKAKPDLLEAALRLAARGKPVLPCSPADKRPLIAGGFKSATFDPALIREWWARWPGALIGVPTGEASGAVVIDVDVKGGAPGLEAWQRLLEEHGAVNTRTVRTRSGGLHLYFAWPGVQVPCSADRLAPGIDVRGDGGYAIVPPSPRYEVIDRAPIAPLPDWLLARLLPPPPAHQPPRPVVRSVPRNRLERWAQAALSRECEAVRRAGFGTQERTLNTAALRIGGIVASGALSFAEARAALLAAALAMASEPGREPWRYGELAWKIDRALRDGARRPRMPLERERAA